MPNTQPRLCKEKENHEANLIGSKDRQTKACSFSPCCYQSFSPRANGSILDMHIHLPPFPPTSVQSVEQRISVCNCLLPWDGEMNSWYLGENRLCFPGKVIIFMLFKVLSYFADEKRRHTLCVLFLRLLWNKAIVFQRVMFVYKNVFKKGSQIQVYKPSGYLVNITDTGTYKTIDNLKVFIVC